MLICIVFWVRLTVLVTNDVLCWWVFGWFAFDCCFFGLVVNSVDFVFCFRFYWMWVDTLDLFIVSLVWGVLIAGFAVYCGMLWFFVRLWLLALRLCCVKDCVWLCLMYWMVSIWLWLVYLWCWVFLYCYSGVTVVWTDLYFCLLLWYLVSSVTLLVVTFFWFRFWLDLYLICLVAC